MNNLLPAPPPRVSIRPLAPDLATSLFELTQAQGRDLAAFAWRAGIQSPQDELAFIQWAAQAERQGQTWSRAILVDGELAGCASLYRPHQGAFPEGQAPDLQVGYWLGRSFRGRKAASQAVALLARELLADMPQATLGIRCRAHNHASIACATALGMGALEGSMPSMFDPADADVVLRGSLAGAALAASSPLRALGHDIPDRCPQRGVPPDPDQPDFARLLAKRRPDLAQALKGPLPQLAQELARFASLGQAMLPVEIHLRCDQGNFVAFGDFLPAFLSSPACAGRPTRELMTLILGASLGELSHAPKDPQRLDPFHFGALSRLARQTDTALEAFVASVCPGWIGARLGAHLAPPTPHEPWLGSTELIFAQAQAQDDPFDDLAARDGAWIARKEQALALASQLGPCAAFAWEPWGEPTLNLRQTLWESFARHVAALPSLHEARLLDQEAAPAPSREARPRI